MIEQQIARALMAGGDLLSIDDLRQLAIAKRVQWWGDETRAAATEVLSYPRRRILNLFMAAGDDVRHVLALQDDIVAFAQSQGCSHMVAHGRPGWGRIGRASGWLPHSIQFVREVPS